MAHAALQTMADLAARRILVIHGDGELVEILRQNLERDGHEVFIEPEGAWALAQARKIQPDLVITELAQVDRTETGLLRQLRSEQDDVPVLVLAPRAEEATRLRGFRLGVDDFLVQPVGISELHRRIDALLARTPPGAARPPAGPVEAVVHFGDVEIHPGPRTVMRGGTPVTLRLKEYDLLLTLVARRGRVVSRAELLREVWGYRTWVATRTVDTHVAELRRKLEDDPANPRYILTVRKVGYRLQRDSGELHLHG